MGHMLKWIASLLALFLASVACDVGVRLTPTIPDNLELSVLISPPDKGYVEIDGAIITSGVDVPFPEGSWSTSSPSPAMPAGSSPAGSAT